KLQVIRTDVGNEPNGRMDDFTEAGRLPAMIHSNFDDSRLVSGSEPKKCVRHSDTVVVVSLGLQCAPALRQDAGDHILCRRLAVASRDGDDRNREPASMMRRKLLIGKQWILNPEQERLQAAAAVLGIFLLPLIAVVDDGPGRSFGQDGLDELMTVEPIAAQGYEKITATDGPRISADAVDSTLDGRRRVAFQDFD